MEFDAVVIGAGPGGYSAAIRLGQLKKKVLVVEKAKIGGVCLNQGCIPTKALLFAAETVDLARQGRSLGIELGTPKVDFTQLMGWKQRVVERLVKGVEFLFKGNSVETIAGEATVLSPEKIAITQNSGEKVEVATSNIVIATGSVPTGLPGISVDNQKIFWAEEALFFDKIPESLLIVGAGATGLEMATIYSRLGTKATIVEIMDQILPGTDAEMANLLMRSVQKQAIDIFISSQVKELRDNEALVIHKDGTEKTVPFERLLLAVGRKPVTENVAALNLKLSRKGFVEVDSSLRTSVPTVFAIGDVNGPPLLAHKAIKEGVVAAEVIAGLKSVYEPKAMPACVFTLPSLACVGMSQEEAVAKGHEVAVGKFPLSASGRAVTLGVTEGMVKVIGDKKTGQLLGLHILGPESSSLIGEGVLALEMGAMVEDIGLSVHPHPTLGETVMEAAENVYKRAIHIVNK
jgi:dihydrolipoamide dehydrogenase